MNWPEIKKAVNSNINKALDILITEKTDALDTKISDLNTITKNSITLPVLDNETIDTGNLVDIYNNKAKKLINKAYQNTEHVFTDFNYINCEGTTEDGNKFLFVYRDNNVSPFPLKGVIGTINPNTGDITWGTTNEIYASCNNWFEICRINDNKLAIIFEPDNSTPHVMVVDTTDDVITVGTAVRLYVSTSYNPGSICKAGDNKFLVVYGSSSYIYARVGTVSGNTITLGTAVGLPESYPSVHVNYIDSAYLEDDKVLVCYMDNYGGRMALVSISGDTVNVASNLIYRTANSSYPCYYRSICKMYNDSLGRHIVLLVDSRNGNNWTNAYTYLINGTTIDAISEVGVTSGTLSTIKVRRVKDNLAYLMYEYSDGIYYRNIYLSSDGTISSLGGQVDCHGTTSSLLSIPRILRVGARVVKVYQYHESAYFQINELYNRLDNGWVGVAMHDALGGENVEILFNGDANIFANLIIGMNYYQNAITNDNKQFSISTNGTVLVGSAISPTTLKITNPIWKR